MMNNSLSANAQAFTPPVNDGRSHDYNQVEYINNYGIKLIILNKVLKYIIIIKQMMIIIMTFMVIMVNLYICNNNI